MEGEKTRGRMNEMGNRIDSKLEMNKI